MKHRKNLSAITIYSDGVLKKGKKKKKKKKKKIIFFLKKKT